MNHKIALVTGASSGIGAAIAAKLAVSGYTVYGTSRNAAQGTQGPFTMISLDVTDDASVAKAVELVIQKEGRID